MLSKCIFLSNSLPVPQSNLEKVEKQISYTFSAYGYRKSCPQEIDLVYVSTRNTSRIGVCVRRLGGSRDGEVSGARESIYEIIIMDARL